MYSYCWVWWNVQTEVDVDEFFSTRDIAFPCSTCALSFNLAFGSPFVFSICSDAHNATD